MEVPVYVGTAGWSLPREYQEQFPESGTHLERHAARFPAVEINSSFYRPHRPATYARWSESVPAAFRFSVKVPREITHRRRLIQSEALLDEFLPGPLALGAKLGCLLVQLPPSLAFHAPTAERFFAALRERYAGPVAAEPRHPTWFTPEGEALLSAAQVGRVAADPAVVPDAALPGGWPGLGYYRLHGAPRIYYSNYEPEYLSRLVTALEASPPDAAVWCIFDNTAEGCATANALEILRLLG
jgi:uncharacterized protein YecE (DUF72 family)